MLSKDWVKDYFIFHKKDRIGLLIVFVVVAACIWVPTLFSKKQGSVAFQKDTVLVLAMDTLRNRQPSRSGNYDRERANPYRYELSESKSFVTGELFPFDPNTISVNDWKRLGLNEKTSKTIINYVSKGGRFYEPGDLLKIWGMPEGFYERVKDYVKINFQQRNPSYNSSRPPVIETGQRLLPISINEADTTILISLPGIGSKLSARIIAFREKLGGFYSVEQISETYGLPDSTFQKIKTRLQVDRSKIRKISINSATKDELKVHPYIRWNLANAIVEYRNQHGNFKSLEDLKNIVLIDEATFEKIVHYLSL